MAPFSNKKKKLQLQQKRQLKRDRNDDPNSFYKSIMQKTHYRGKPIGQQNNNKIASSDQVKRNEQGPGRMRFADLQFFKDTDEEIKLRKEQSLLPVVPLEYSDLEMDAESPVSSLDMPKRPPWNKSMAREQLERQEQIYFKNFVDDILEQSSLLDKKLSYFDLNLETWRQLWRVLEMSEVITIIVDIRHPLFHFPPSLYKHIVSDLKKEVIIVLNKVDLVPASLVLAWQTYLKSQYPEVHVLPFASYAGMKTKSNGKRVGNLHMAAEGAKRFLLQVEQIVGSKNIDFTSWREKIQADTNEMFEDDLDNDDGDDKEDNNDTEACQSDSGKNALEEDEDDDDEETNFGAKALKKAEQILAKNDTGFYSEDRYKDGILTIGCVGHPNVGKSSFMNALIGRKIVSVSRTPGHTKHFQTIFLTPNIRLCDCPGLVFPSYFPKQLQVLMGCYPISQLREPYSSIQYLAERVNMVEKLRLKPIDEIRHQKPALNDLNYTPINMKTVDKLNGKKHVAGTSEEWSPYMICESWAVHKGFLTARSGRPDVYRAANHILRMALDGRTLCMAFYPPDYLAQRESLWNHHEQIGEMSRIQGKHNIIDDDNDGY